MNPRKGPAALLFDAGARRVRLVESTTSRFSLETTLGLADWDLKALAGLGEVEFENTRNLGKGARYAQVPVPGGGYLFSSFQLNHSYVDTEVLISLAKLKHHVTAGVTLAMKNLFGLTPNSLYGDQAGSEDALGGRTPLHAPGTAMNPKEFVNLRLPGLKQKPGELPTDPGYRIPRIVADICAARPVELSIVDGITAMAGGEGPWCGEAGDLTLTQPGLLVAGLNPVSTDAVCTALMGADPRATRGTPPFAYCDNHLLLAEQAGVGLGDLGRIDLLGWSLEKARYPYPLRKG